MTRMPQIDAKQVIKFLKDHGYKEHRQRGSHLILYNPSKEIVLSVPVHSGKDIGHGFTSKILKQAGYSSDDYIRWKKK